MAKPQFTYRYYSPSLRRFVSADYKGEKRRVKIRINYEALKRAGQKQSREAKKRREKKRRTQAKKKLRGKRSTASRKFGIRTRKGKHKGKDSQVYNVPFSYDGDLRQWVVDRPSIAAVFDIERQFDRDKPPVVRAWVWVAFKDQRGEYIPLPVGGAQLADEPDGAENISNAIDSKFLDYDVADVESVDLEVIYGDKL